MPDNYSGRAFRKSIVWYTGGRLLNALAGFLILVWIARTLPAVQYANYIAAYAMLEMGLVLSSFGLEWVTGVVLPQVRQKSSGRALNRFVLQCAALQATILLAGAGVLYLLAPALTAWLRLQDARWVVELYALVMFAEGVSRMVRDQLLSCLLLQGAAQAAQLMRNASMLVVVLVLLDQERWRNAQALAMGEIGASLSSLLLAGALLWRHLRAGRAAPAAEPAWARPRWPAMLRIGRNAWLSNIANLAWGPQAVVLLATRLIGVEATAPLGFARNLADQVRKYMPMEFLFGIARTLLVVRFASEQSVERLGDRIGMMYKANLLFLLPLLALVLAHGRELCLLLSAGRYGEAHWLLAGWLAVLTVAAHRRLSDLLAHILGRSIVTARASLGLLVVPLGLYAVLRGQQWTLLFGLLAVAELAYSGFVVAQAGRAGWHYRPDWVGIAKFAVACALAALCVHALGLGAGPAAAVGAALGAALVFLAALMLMRPWTENELELMPPRIAKWSRFKLGGL